MFEQRKVRVRGEFVSRSSGGLTDSIATLNRHTYLDFKCSAGEHDVVFELLSVFDGVLLSGRFLRFAQGKKL